MSELSNSPYNRYCPTCGAPTVRTHRNPDGPDVCDNGHEYNPRDAITRKQAEQISDDPAATLAAVREAVQECYETFLHADQIGPTVSATAALEEINKIREILFPEEAGA